MHRNGNAIDIVIENVKTINLKFPKTYKHVGTRYGANLNAEVFARCGIISQGAGALQKKVLQNTSIKLEKRLAILSAYIFTKALFNVAHGLTFRLLRARGFMGLYEAVPIYDRLVTMAINKAVAISLIATYCINILLLALKP